jgi:hypothetical protein
MDATQILGPLGLIENIVNSFGFYIKFGLIILLILHVRDIHTIIEYFSLRQQVSNNLFKWKDGRLDLKDIHGLSQRQFEYWCGEFIIKFGYTDINQSPMGPDGGVDIVCNLKDDIFYVQCKRYSYGKNAKFVVDSKVCENLVGAMKAKVCELPESKGSDTKITRGMIITTGRITNEAIQFIKTLPDEYKIEVIDGNDILERYAFLYKYKLRIVN